MRLVNYREEKEIGSGRDLFQAIKPTFAQDKPLWKDMKLQARIHPLSYRIYTYSAT